MRQTLKISGILLMLILAGNGSLFAQRGMGGMRGMKGMADTTRAVRPGAGSDFRQQPLSPGFARRPMYGWGRGMGPMGWQGRNNFVRPGMRGFGPGNMRGMNHFGPAARPQVPGPGFRALDNIPDLTDKQKKEIAELRQKQQEEMKAFRDDAAKKMQTLRDSHRNKMMDLLTDEQKKAVESRQGKINTPAPSNK